MDSVVLLGVDLESDSLDPKTANMLEIGAVLFDWDTKTPVKIMSELIDPMFDGPEKYAVPPEITEITGITTDLINHWGEHEADALNDLMSLETRAQFWVGHNCNNFDAPLLNARLEKNHLTGTRLSFLDTSIDIKYPPLIRTRNLRHLAAEHDFLNPFPHRAVFDVLTMFRVMSHYDLNTIIARSKEPIVCLQALVKYEENEKAKSRGYRWHPPSKAWWKVFKLSDAEAEERECDFRTVRLEKAPE